MTDAEILEDRRARVEMLLAMIPDGPMSQVGLDQVAGDPASLASAVDPNGSWDTCGLWRRALGAT